MTAWQGMRIALRALRVNIMRSVLTMLGIIIGVGAVIVMVAIGSGAQARVTEQIQSLGSNLIMVRPGSVNSAGTNLGAGSRRTLIEDDADAIEREIAAVHTAAPMVRGAEQVVSPTLNWSTVIMGVTPEYLEARDWSLVAGRQLSVEDVEGASKVALIGQTAVGNLFGDVEPVGQTVRIRNVPFTIVGVLDRKGQTTSGQDQDDVVLLPLSTAKKKVIGVGKGGPRAVDAIAVKIQAGEDMDEAEADLRTLLRQRHRLKADQQDDFRLSNLADVLETQEQSSRVLTYLLAAIASVSLMVGGIGIMNIMLVSVTERTREIGLRMAVGARGTDILTQFLVEAVTLSLIGGVIGVGLGIASSHLISVFADWRTIIAPEAVALAFGFAGAVGIFFGFYPARKASRLDPIEALRFE